MKSDLYSVKSQVKLVLSTQIQNSPLLAPGTGSLRRRQNWTTLLQGSSRRRQNCALLARVFRAAGKGAADELAPSHSVYAYPKNPPQINVAWIPAAEAAVDWGTLTVSLACLRSLFKRNDAPSYLILCLWAAVAASHVTVDISHVLSPD